ncbi:glycoside hydrolase [Xylariaceae sp. FL0016]|nr:glycoside hydrolase [Xylariaceae sp. FL0016]
MIMLAQKTAVALATLTSFASAYDVFAHYMVQGLTDGTDHASQDVTTALNMGVAAFALNVGSPSADWSTDAIEQLFDAASGTDFKLFFSMDMAQESDAYAFKDLIQKYLDHDSYYTAGDNDSPFLSTFQSAEHDADYWSTFLGSLGRDVYFVPMFDETSGYYTDISSWTASWGGVVDGLFSWETSWPYSSDTPMNVSTESDEYVMNGISTDKAYMIGLSSLQFKRWSGFHYYRTGEVNLPQRMTEILALESRPAFVEVQTWNDAGESHYIGHLWSEGLDDDIMAYANQEDYPHTGWQSLITSFITAYKNGADASGMRPPEGSDVIGAFWYRALTVDADCTSDTMGKPGGAGAAQDAVNWAVVVGDGVSGYKVQVWSDSVMIRSTNLDAGLNYFSAPGLKTGSQYVEVVDSDYNIIISAHGGKDVSSTADGICNYNFQVAELK